MKKAITQKEYLTLLGPILVAKKHDKITRSCIESIGEIVNEDDPLTGHSCDIAYGERDLDDWLRIQGIKIEYTPTATSKEKD